MPNAFKSASNQYYTRSLFLEQWEALVEDQREGKTPTFTLSRDEPGYINARTTFLSLNDPTGYLWAKQYLNGSYEHWQKLVKCSWFREALEDWVLELKMRLRVAALEVVRSIAFGEVDSPPATVLAAARYLAEAGWEQRETAGRGRPSKEEISGELKRQLKTLSEEQSDIERIGGLKLINGGKQQSSRKA